eukprot:gnl/MRDRNA2_/MRDRNA2_61696_c0_seq1.p1 gnl/MRDRNA2_/MRDRNA2_61696_c0~~gnl/MRDRNA2_/MRDRNA2_61696_c0_seq1.p1  ORF type:complete len:547 (-),score=101.96 gnl/MRDRNA2_/MRDRNA2_61696_c0_seq1:110-1750(-)
MTQRSVSRRSAKDGRVQARRANSRDAADWLHDVGHAVLKHRRLGAFLQGFHIKDWADVLVAAARLGLAAFALLYGEDELRGVDVTSLQALVDHVESHGSWPATVRKGLRVRSKSPQKTDVHGGRSVYDKSHVRTEFHGSKHPVTNGHGHHSQPCLREKVSSVSRASQKEEASSPQLLGTSSRLPSALTGFGRSRSNSPSPSRKGSKSTVAKLQHRQSAGAKAQTDHRTDALLKTLAVDPTSEEDAEDILLRRLVNRLEQMKRFKVAASGSQNNVTAGSNSMEVSAMQSQTAVDTKDSTDLQGTEDSRASKTSASLVSRGTALGAGLGEACSSSDAAGTGLSEMYSHSVSGMTASAVHTNRAASERTLNLGQTTTSRIDQVTATSFESSTAELAGIGVGGQPIRNDLQREKNSVATLNESCQTDAGTIDAREPSLQATRKAAVEKDLRSLGGEALFGSVDLECMPSSKRAQFNNARAFQEKLHSRVSLADPPPSSMVWELSSREQRRQQHMVNKGHSRQKDSDEYFSTLDSHLLDGMLTMDGEEWDF